MAAFLNKLTYLGFGMAAVGAVGSMTLYNVEGGHRAVIFDRLKGINMSVIGEGTHFRIPVIQDPIIFDVRSQPYEKTVRTPSKDLQTVDLSLRVLFRPEVEQLPAIYKTIGARYDQTVLPSIVTEVLKAAVAQFDAGELITLRETVSTNIRAALVDRADQFGIKFDDISITHLTFGREFTQAVEMKQVAQQEAERAKFVVEQSEQEKLAKIIRAEGDSKAAQLISKSLVENGQGLIELRKIDAAKEIAATLSKSRNVAYLPGGKNLLLNMAI